MPWRYQPVFEDQDGERSFYMCEVYFDDAGNFNRWSDMGVSPGGEDLEDMTADMTRMLVDAYSWKPARFSELRPGYVFERRIAMDERNKLADYINEVKDTFQRQPPLQQN